MTEQEPSVEQFDFDGHRATAEQSYRLVRREYEELAGIVEGLLIAALSERGIRLHSVESRAKTIESFGEKASRPSKDNSEKLYYEHPLEGIEDQAGCRVITFFLKDVPTVGEVIASEFEILSSADRSTFLREGGARLGYESMHYVVKLKASRTVLTEYARYAGLKVEVQVRTILQHAWAEIEHDMNYKTADALPSEIARRFLALAGMVEISDREFQAIADAYENLRADAVDKITKRQYGGVEMTPETLKFYLDATYGADKRVSQYSYGWVTRNLKRMGFQSIGQLDECIAGYDAIKLSRALYRNKQGQLNRLEYAVAAGMGPNFLRLHPWAERDADGRLPEWLTHFLDRVENAAKAQGKQMGSYDPNFHTA